MAPLSLSNIIFSLTIRATKNSLYINLLALLVRMSARYKSEENTTSLGKSIKKLTKFYKKHTVFQAVAKFLSKTFKRVVLKRLILSSCFETIQPGFGALYDVVSRHFQQYGGRKWRFQCLAKSFHFFLLGEENLFVWSDLMSIMVLDLKQFSLFLYQTNRVLTKLIVLNNNRENIITKH